MSNKTFLYVFSNGWYSAPYKKSDKAKEQLDYYEAKEIEFISFDIKL